MQQVISDGHWDLQQIAHRIWQLPVLILFPIITLKLTSVDLFAGYKFIFPLIAMLIPVVLYAAYKKIFGGENALLSGTIFLSQLIFFSWISVTLKMILTELFLALILLLIFNFKITSNQTILNILYIMCSLGLICSHYGTAFIFMFALAAYMVITMIMKIYAPKMTFINPINPFGALLYILLSVAWFVYTSIGSSDNTAFGGLTTGFVRLNDLILDVIRGSGLGDSSYAVQILQSGMNIDIQLIKFVYVSFAALIAIGLMSRLFKQLYSKCVHGYDILSFIFFVIFIVSNVSGGLSYGGGRILSIASLLLTPYAIVGLRESIRYVWDFACTFRADLKHRFTKTNLTNITKHTAIIYVSLFFLINTGVLTEIVLQENSAGSVFISAPRIMNNGDLSELEALDRYTLDIEDWQCMNWIRRNMASDTIYTDYHGRVKFWLLGITYKAKLEGFGDPLIEYISPDRPFESDRYLY
ncbi:MAG: DUF2206 domain-containing protein, partial [Clostridiales bacterium]|nr:DUF2206 domain-containing protein [Clostridiales bacterium]